MPMAICDIFPITDMAFQWPFLGKLKYMCELYDCFSDFSSALLCRIMDFCFS